MSSGPKKKGETGHAADLPRSADSCYSKKKGRPAFTRRQPRMPTTPLSPTIIYTTIAVLSNQNKSGRDANPRPESGDATRISRVPYRPADSFHSNFGLRHSFVIRYSDFVIRARARLSESRRREKARLRLALGAGSGILRVEADRRAAAWDLQGRGGSGDPPRKKRLRILAL
jgi:hypothetical protein